MPAVAGAIVTAAATHGDAKLFDALTAAAERAVSPDEHYRYLFALAAFQDPALIRRGLERIGVTRASQSGHRALPGAVLLQRAQAGPGVGLRQGALGGDRAEGDDLPAATRTWSRRWARSATPARATILRRFSRRIRCPAPPAR